MLDSVIYLYRNDLPGKKIPAMKLRCTCGNTIADNSDHLSYKANLFPDTESDDFFGGTDRIQEFVRAIRAGKREAWIKAQFGTTYDVNSDHTDDMIICDLQSFAKEGVLGKCRNIFQCDKCNRIAIQVKHENQFAFFIPEPGYDCANLLSGDSFS